MEGDPAHDFGVDWIEAWTRSENYRIWDRYTDSHLFDIVEPKHPCAGGLTIDDVQRRIAEQVKEFHLDERFAVGKEVLGRNLQAGREKASTVFNRLYADMEALRESQRRKHEEQKREAERNGGQGSPGYAADGHGDKNGVNKTVQTVSSKAGAYIGSWGTWMGEKRKVGWGRSSSGNQTTTPKNQKEKEKENSLPSRQQVRDEKMIPDVVPEIEPTRPKSYNENLFDADNPGNPPPKTSRVSAASIIDPHPALPSRFHEEINETPEQSPSMTNVAVMDAKESSKRWEERSPVSPDVGAEERNRVAAVAEAVARVDGAGV